MMHYHSLKMPSLVTYMYLLKIKEVGNTTILMVDCNERAQNNISMDAKQQDAARKFPKIY